MAGWKNIQVDRIKLYQGEIGNQYKWVCTSHEKENVMRKTIWFLLHKLYHKKAKEKPKYRFASAQQNLDNIWQISIWWHSRLWAWWGCSIMSN